MKKIKGIQIDERTVQMTSDQSKINEIIDEVEYLRKRIQTLEDRLNVGQHSGL